jgi:hypothetical protein
MDSEAIIKDRRFAIASRIFLLLVFPFILGALVLPHTQYIDGTQLTAPSENQSSSAGMLSYSFNHSEDTIGPALNALFPLANYLDFPPFVSQNRVQMCFADSGSGIILPNGTRLEPPFQWVIGINGRSEVRLDSNSVACSDINGNGKNSFSWNANISAGLSEKDLNSTLVFDPQTSTYPRHLIDYGLLQGLVMMPLFYLLVWYPAFGIWKKIRHGMQEQ